MTNLTRERRLLRSRRKLQRPVATERLRLSVFRSAKHIYAQVIDPAQGRTVAEANSKTLGISGNKTEQATAVGKTIAERAVQAGVKKVVFDRGAYRYHGRIRALADGASQVALEL